MTRAALDVSQLPEYGFGHRSLLWWATMCLIAIEATAFGLLMMTYMYLKGRVPHWPPGLGNPALRWGTLNLIVLLVSALPNELTKKAAERLDLRGVQLWMAVSIAFAVAFNVIRFIEFGALNTRWDTNAYGSIVWMLLGTHTVHVLTDLLDTVVLAVVMFVGPVDEHRFVDVSENSMYWYFVVLTWIPIYALIYLAPRFV